MTRKTYIILRIICYKIETAAALCTLIIIIIYILYRYGLLKSTRVLLVHCKKYETSLYYIIAPTDIK